MAREDLRRVRQVQDRIDACFECRFVAAHEIRPANAAVGEDHIAGKQPTLLPEKKSDVSRRVAGEMHNLESQLADGNGFTRNQRMLGDGKIGNLDPHLVRYAVHPP